MPGDQPESRKAARGHQIWKALPPSITHTLLALPEGQHKCAYQGQPGSTLASVWASCAQVFSDPNLVKNKNTASKYVEWNKPVHRIYTIIFANNKKKYFVKHQS